MSEQDKAARYGLRKTPDGYQVDAQSLLSSVGGVQGLIETTLPGFLYVLSYTIFRNITVSIATVAVSVVGLTIRHVVMKRPWTQLIGSLVGVALAIYLTLRPGGQAADYYLKDFWINGAYGSALLISILVRFPLIGVIVGFLTNQGLQWRKVPKKLRYFDLVTLLWVGLFATRLGVELPLYLAGDVVILGFVKIVLGLPFYLTMIWVSWLLLRRVVRAELDGNLD
jgi:hypothetical protein